jgi:hypothetical protein
VLAIAAYRQPIARAGIELIRVRGSRSGPTNRTAASRSQSAGGVSSTSTAVANGSTNPSALAVTKRAGDPISPAEERLLNDLAAQASLAMRNVRLAAELRARVEEVSAQA